jgi:hypothetical protein
MSGMLLIVELDTPAALVVVSVALITVPLQNASSQTAHVKTDLAERVLSRAF